MRILICAVLLPLAAWGREVELKQGEGGWQLFVDGKPYLIQGACSGEEKFIPLVREYGGNSIRTYGNLDLEKLKLANQHGLTVMYGFWISPERHGFNHNDEAAVAAEIEKHREHLRKVMNDPSIIVWGAGNEVELKAKDPDSVWRTVEKVARMIKEEDPKKRPIATVVAGFDEAKIEQIKRLCPSVDILGVNWYGAYDWPAKLKQFGWDRPYIITEFGPRGYWDAPSTEWGAPVEQTSTQKAAIYLKTWQMNVANQPGYSLGGYSFFWSHKQERTHTWFSMFLPTGERTGAVDAMQFAWTGRWPENPAPEILDLGFLDPAATFTPGSKQYVQIVTRSHTSEPLAISGEIQFLSTAKSDGGDIEEKPETVENAAFLYEAETGQISFITPQKPGFYRIFVYAKNPAHHTAATGNLNFRVDVL